MEKPLVSIIIPAYNANKHIKRSVFSALRQTYSNVEVLVVDDCSSDGTADIVNKLQQIYSNLNMLSLKQNVGPYQARIDGIRQASGDFAMFLDADDELCPDAVKRLVEAAVSSDSDVVVMGAKYSFLSGLLRIPFSIPSRTYHQPSYCHADILNDIITPMISKRGVTCSMCDKIYSRKLLDTIDFIDYSGHCGEDLVFNMQVMPRAEKLSWIDYPGYLWRYNGANVKYATRMWDDLQQTYPALHSLIEQYNVVPALKEQWHRVVEQSRFSDLQEATIQRLYILHKKQTEVDKWVYNELQKIKQQNRYYIKDLSPESADDFIQKSREYFRNHRKFYNFMRIMSWSITDHENKKIKSQK